MIHTIHRVAAAGGLALILGVPALAQAAKPEPTYARHGTATTIRGAAGDALVGDGKGAFTYSQDPTYITDQLAADGVDEHATFVGGSRSFTLSYPVTNPDGTTTRRTQLCAGMSWIRFDSRALPDWYGSLDPGESTMGDGRIRCAADGSANSFVVLLRFLKPGDDASASCVQVRRTADVSGHRAYEFEPRPFQAGSPGSPGRPPDALWVLTGGTAGDPGEPATEPTPDTPACTAYAYRLDVDRNGKTRSETLIGQGPAPMLVRAVAQD